MRLERIFETLTAYWTGSSIYFQLFRFSAVLVIGAVLTRALLIPAVSRIYSRKNEEAINSVQNITTVIGLFITFTVALQAGGFGGLVSVLAAIGAAVTVAIGFGMRDQVSNLVAGVLIHLDNPIARGDYIKVGDTEGTVQNISMRATALNGHDNEKQLVPNAMLTTSVLKNYTKERKTKVSTEIKVELENAEKASEILMKEIEGSELALEKPEPKIRFQKIDEGKLEMEATFWVKKAEQVKEARSEILKAYTSKIRDEGLSNEE